MELELIRTDGTTRWVSACGGATHGKDGRVIGLQGTLQDITLRKLAEEKLRASEEKYRILFDNASEAICVIQEGRVVFLNPATSMLTGYSAGEIQTRPFIDFVHPDDRKMVLDRHVRRIKGENVTQRYPFRLVHKNSAILWVELNTVLIDWQEKPATLNFLSDITLRRQIEEIQTFLAQASSGLPDEPFFETLAKYLARKLDMDYVCIDRLERDGLNATTVAIWRDGQFEDNVTYALKDTPCGNVVGKTVCSFPAGVCQSFPHDQVLQDLQAESYVGVTLWGHEGPPIGLIALISRRPLTNRELAEKTLQMVAVRATGELERLAAEEAARKSEETYRALFNQMLDGFALHEILCDKEGHPADYRFLAINPAFEHMTGMKAEDIVGRTVLEALPGTEQHWIETFGRVALTGESVIFENYSSELNKHFEVMAFRPAPNQFACIFTDITGRKLAETSLKMSEEKFAKAFEASPESITIASLEDGTYIEVNDVFLERTGFSRHEVIGHTSSELNVWVNSEDRQRFVDELCKNGFLRDFEIQYRMRAGDIRDFSVSSEIIELDGKSCSLNYIFDITERRQKETAIRESEEKFSKAFENAPMMLTISAIEDGRILDINKAFTRLSGFSREEAIGKTTVELGWTNPDDRRRFIADLNKTGSINGLDLTVKAKDGRKIICLIYGQIINISNQQHLLIIGQDITERRQAEEEKEKLQAQLTQAQKMESVGRLAGGVAHDFNNMLGVIIGRAEMAMDEVDPALPIHTDLAEIRKAAERSANLTRQLLAFARKQNFAPQVLDLNEVVEGMLKMLRRLIGEDIHLAWLPQSGLWPVNIDPSQLDQILANLCVNARDAIAGVGKMIIETGNTALDEEFCTGHTGFIPGEYVRITVSDNGCGMDRETLDHIFEPFYTTKGAGEGTGLGLSTVYGAVKQSNGFINVYSEPGQGTTFTIYLPRHKGKTERIKDETRMQPAARGNETILVVEDELAMLKLTTKILKNQGYTVLESNAPVDAIRLARDYQGEIHLLITDVVMPDMNGKDLAENLLSIYPLLHTLFMSGYTANIIQDNVSTDKVRHFIQKPFTAKALAAKVRDALNGLSRS